PSSSIPNETRPIPAPMTGGNVGIFEAVFGRPRANINRPPVPPILIDVHNNPWDRIIARGVGAVENNHDMAINAPDGTFIPHRRLNRYPAALLDRPGPLQDIAGREDERQPNVPYLAQPPASIEERRERIRRRLIRHQPATENRVIVRTNQTGAQLWKQPPRNVFRRPPPSPGRPGPALNNWNELNGNSSPRASEIRGRPLPVTSHLQNPSTISQPNETRRRRPGGTFDLTSEQEGDQRNRFWDHLPRLGEAGPVCITVVTKYYKLNIAQTY
ncbi:14380_t:CDS:2, partial [Acaulospora colombiana]